MNLRLSYEARRGWDKICQEKGVTLTAFVEAIGLELDERGMVTGRGDAVVERAREIDLERRERR